MIVRRKRYQGWVTLLEILRIFANDYVRTAVSLDTANVTLTRQSIWEDEAEHSALKQTLEGLGTICVAGELPVTRVRVDEILEALNSSNRDLTDDLLQHYLFELRNRFIDEIGTKLYLQVPSSKKGYFDLPRQGWEEVIEKFPDTLTDIEEMSKCFALSRYAGSVFHSLLVVERGLIELGRCIGCNDPKAGWDATWKKLKELVTGGHSKLPTDFPLSFSVIEQLCQSMEAMKMAWRNKIYHSAGKMTVLTPEFVPDVAEEIMIATRAFMRRLANDLPLKQGV